MTFLERLLRMASFTVLTTACGGRVSRDLFGGSAGTQASTGGHGAMCMSNSQCPQSEASCEPCPSGNAACPRSKCESGYCVSGIDTCRGSGGASFSGGAGGGALCVESLDCASQTNDCLTCGAGRIVCATSSCVNGLCVFNPPSCGSGGAPGTGEMGGSAGASAAGSGGSSPGCCQKDFDCGDLVYVPCVNGVCKNTASGRCWTDAECRSGGSCVGAFVCGCRLLCDQSDVLGECQTPIADAGADSGQSMCFPPPNLPPTSTSCTDLPYSAASESYVIWIADSSAPNGGYSLALAKNQATTVGGHTYKNTSAGLVGGGVHGVYGDAWFDVDGHANALGFHFEGCAVPTSTNTWELVAAVTRNGPSCTSCPEMIQRHYIIRHTGSGSTGRYSFDAEAPPQGCGLGADLLEIVLYE